MEGSNEEIEYAAQYLGFVPNTFVDDLSEDCMDLVADSLEAMKQQLMKKFPGKFDEEELVKSFKNVEVKYQENQEKIFEKLGSFICAHMLKIPGHVLLPEDEAWDGETADGVSSKLITVNTRMGVMRDEIKRALYLKAVLSSQFDNIKEVCKSQEAVIDKDKERFKMYEDCNNLMDFSKQNRKILASKSKELEDVTGVSSEADNNRALDNLTSNKRKGDIVETNLDGFMTKMRKQQSTIEFTP